MSTVTTPTPAESNTRAKRWRPEYTFPATVLFLALLVVVVGGLMNDTFLTLDNAQAILRSASLVGIVGLGATFITVSGRLFSLALAQTTVFCAITFALVMRAEIPIGLSLVITLAVGTIIGLIQGGLVSMGANAIVTTLGAGALLAGLAGWVTGGTNVRFASDAAKWLGSERPLGVATQTWAFVILAVVAWWVMSKTRIGRNTLLVGANRLTASASGVSVWRVTLFAFAVASVGAAIVGVFGASQFTQARINEFVGLDFDVIAAVLIGGTAIQGGVGSPVRTALGAVFIAMTQNFMLLLGWPFGVRTLILGTLIVIAVVSFHVLRRRSGSSV